MYQHCWKIFESGLAGTVVSFVMWMSSSVILPLLKRHSGKCCETVSDCTLLLRWNLWLLDSIGQGVGDSIWALSVFVEIFLEYEVSVGCVPSVSLKATNGVFDSNVRGKMFYASIQWNGRTRMGRGKVVVTFISSLFSIFIFEEDEPPFMRA